MTFRENPVFGRKVFFIDPPYTIEHKVIEKLKEQEYEVYILKDYTFAKSVLRNFENAICFINIKQQLSLKEWYNYIKSFQYDDTLKSVFLGIMASKVPESSIEKFIMNLKLPGGYIGLDGITPEEITKKISGILEINGAKGKRKYLSLTCSKDEALTGYIAHGNKLFTMTFENISSIGISCFLDNDLSKILVKNTLLTNVSLSLGRWSVITQCIVYSINEMNGKTTALLLFAKGTPKETKDSLRKYIYDVLDKKLQQLIKGSTEDNENYFTMTFPSDGQETPDYNPPTEEDSEVENAEPLDEEEDTGKAEESEAKAPTEITEEESETKQQS